MKYYWELYTQEDSTFVWTWSIQVKLEFGDVGFCGGRKMKESGEKPSEQGLNHQQTQPHMAAGWNQTRAILVGGEH